MEELRASEVKCPSWSPKVLQSLFWRVLLFVFFPRRGALTPASTRRGLSRACPPSAFRPQLLCLQASGKHVASASEHISFVLSARHQVKDESPASAWQRPSWPENANFFVKHASMLECLFSGWMIKAVMKMQYPRWECAASCLQTKQAIIGGYL